MPFKDEHSTRVQWLLDHGVIETSDDMPRNVSLEWLRNCCHENRIGVAVIKPVWRDGGKLISLALCRSDTILTDSDIVEHFPPDTPGRDIKAVAVANGWVFSMEDISWGSPINS